MAASIPNMMTHVISSGARFAVAAILFAAVFQPSAAHAGDPSLKITALPKKERGALGGKQNVAAAESAAYYQVTLLNQSRMEDSPALRAEYRIFVLKDDGMKNPRDIKLKKVPGEADIPAIERSKSYSFDTKSVKLVKTTLDPGWYYSSGKRQATTDKMEGIWIKIFSGDQLVTELASPASLSRNEQF